MLVTENLQKELSYTLFEMPKNVPGEWYFIDQVTFNDQKV